MSNTRIIAEIGVNHNGFLEQALALVDVCASAGVDIVKFQTFSAERLILKDAPKADYQVSQDDQGSQFDMLKSLELSVEDHRTLMDYCVKNGVEFLSTAFDAIDLEMLVKLGIKQIKIPSGEMTNLPYLRAAASYKMPILMSTGMANMEEIKASVSALLLEGLDKSDLTILHCSSSYPAKDADLNLLAMKNLKDTFGVSVGYSDHSEGILASLIASSMGAVIIEKHITLDRGLPGPDHKASIEPHELNELVHLIRRKDIIMGTPIKKPSSDELKMAAVARKSIVANAVIKKGDILKESNLTQKRPGTGLCPMRWDEVIDTIAVKDFFPDEQIILKMDDND